MDTRVFSRTNMRHVAPVVLSIPLVWSDGGVENTWCTSTLHHIGEVVDVGYLRGVVNKCSIPYRTQGGDQERSSRGVHIEEMGNSREETYSGI